MDLLVPPGAFHPRSDTWMLRDRLLDGPIAGERLLEVCAGPGAIAIAAAAVGARATAVELTRRGAFAARWNARRAGVRVEVLRGDLFAPVGERCFDIVVSNPPYVPSAAHRVPRRGAKRAWEAGNDGRIVLDRLIAGLPQAVAPGGRVLLVHSSLIGEDQTLADLRSVGFEARVVDRQRGPLGPLMAAQEAAGRIAPTDGTEELLIFEGRAPGGAPPAVVARPRPRRRHRDPLPDGGDAQT